MRAKSKRRLRVTTDGLNQEIGDQDSGQAKGRADVERKATW